MMVSRFVFGALAAASFLVGAQAQAETLTYTVTRDGSTIGTHSVDINAAGTEVQVETDIEVKVLFVTAYKFKHTSQEKWQNGQLVAITSTTDDDGTPKELNARLNGDQMKVNSIVKGQDRLQTVPADTLPASLWNPATVEQSALLNTLDGQIMTIDVENKGADTVETGAGPVQANHYAITGELTRDLWFDGQGRLVRMRFPDKTNSEIVYALD